MIAVTHDRRRFASATAAATTNRPPIVNCRPGRGACCIAPSMCSPTPGMPQGKPAGLRCVQLAEDPRGATFGPPDRPACCSRLQPSPQRCGDSRQPAPAWLARLETATSA
jgi:hypothetical protein